MAQRHKLQTFLAPILLPFSYLYGWGMFLREKAYRKGFIPSYAPSSPCISVGNISWGGTGKTPIIEALLDWAKENDIQTSVLTRSYKSKLTHVPRFVNPVDMDEADEPRMLAINHIESRIIADSNRARGVRLAEDHVIRDKPHIFLMDDGFQHLALQRHCDLVLFDIEDLKEDSFLFGESNWNRVIPLGTWREDQRALNRADAFIIKCPPESFFGIKGTCLKILATYQKPLFVFHMRADYLKNVISEKRVEANTLKSYAIVCGVGNPKQAESTIQNYMGKAPEKSFFMPDHYDFTPDIQELMELSQKIPIVCTGKDAVKLGPLMQNYVSKMETKQNFDSFPVYCMHTTPTFYDFLGDITWDKWWDDKYKSMVDSLKS